MDTCQHHGANRHMVSRCLPVAVLLLFVSASAFAEDVKPCERDSHARAGTADTDVLRCRMFLAAQRLADMAAEADQYKAMYAIALADAEKMRREKEAQTAKDASMAQWFREWFGR